MISPWRVSLEILRTHLQGFSRFVIHRYINLTIWMSTILLVNAYLLPYFGVRSSYGSFMLAGLMASVAIFEMFNHVIQLISDLNHERVIGYYALLPITRWHLFGTYLAYYTLAFLAVGIPVLPYGALFTGNPGLLWSISWIRFIPFWILSAFFCSSITLWIASFIREVKKAGNVWMRILYPAWILGCFQFSWQAMYSVTPLGAYIILFNPFTYLMEGFRSTIMGPAEFLPWWPSVAVLAGAALIFSFFAIRRFTYRLDLV